SRAPGATIVAGWPWGGPGRERPPMPTPVAPPAALRRLPASSAASTAVCEAAAILRGCKDANTSIGAPLGLTRHAVHDLLRRVAREPAQHAARGPHRERGGRGVPDGCSGRDTEGLTTMSETLDFARQAPPVRFS